MDVVTSTGESDFATPRDFRSLDAPCRVDAAADFVVAKITVLIGANEFIPNTADRGARRSIKGPIQ